MWGENGQIKNELWENFAQKLENNGVSFLFALDESG